MDILCHRGWWTRPDEKNSIAALRRAFDAGLGVETDLRDCRGHVVVSHDPPTGGEPTLAELLELHRAAPHAVLALNVKADGLAVPVAKQLADRGVTDAAFVFDMSVPDQLQWLRTDVSVYTRHSDVETEPVLYDGAAGVWLDDFAGEQWWTATTVRRHLAEGRRVAIVSPELHGRDPGPAWRVLLADDLHRSPGLFLCTDLPAEALEAFR